MFAIPLTGSILLGLKEAGIQVLELLVHQAARFTVARRKDTQGRQVYSGSG
jgi:hypothetical protein